MAVAATETISTTEPTGFDGYPNSRDLLEKYAGYSADEIEDAVLSLRDRAWETFPFPRIGAFDFLDLALSNRTRVYHKLLTRLQAGDTFLDVGRCLGHDIRKLVFDGAPAENMFGADLLQGYVDLGYNLFRDRDTLKTKFVQANVLDDITTGAWPELVGKFDTVSFSLVLHCFPWERQVAMLERGVAVLKEGKLGTTTTGTACGVEEAPVEDWNGKVPVHNPEPFRKLMAEVEAKTGTKWKVDVALDNCYSRSDPRYSWIAPKMKRLVFELTRVG
ncbi:hypothetical protein OQA88_783 [Cercophora sp. LCS_1]